MEMNQVMNGDDDEDVVLIKDVDDKKKSILILRSKTAEDQLDLVQKYPDYCDMAENESLNFLNKLSHPVISSFRDLNKMEINYIVNTFKKWKTHERSISFLLLIDYLTMSIENPLYSDHISLHFKSLYSDMIKKILMELKTIIFSWSFSDQSEIKERSKSILRYLRLLLPIFESLPGPDGIDKIIKNIINAVENRQSLKRSLTDTDTDTVTLDDDRTILIEIPDNLTDEQSFNNQLKSQSSKGKETKGSSTIDKFFAKSSTNNTTIKNASPIKSSSSPSPTKKPRFDENNEIEVCQILPKQNSDPVPSTSSTNPKPQEKKKVNAFALMMNQSRMKSQIEKERKKGAQISKHVISKK